jgi:hypothetical protein
MVQNFLEILDSQTFLKRISLNTIFVFVSYFFKNFDKNTFKNMNPRTIYRYYGPLSTYKRLGMQDLPNTHTSSHTHTHTHTHTHILTHTHSHTHSHTHTHTHPFAHKLTHSHTNYTLSHILTHIHSHTHTHTLTLTHTHTI